jgi:glycolate oxidase iron-sulfur subunit
MKILEPLLLARIPESSGLYYRYSFLFEKGRFIPQLVRKPFSERYRSPIPGEKRKPVVLFFTGCMINFLYPQIGESVIKILNAMDCNVLLPKEQNCCGFPALASGDILASRKLAEKNFEELSGHNFDAIVVACASCGTAFKKIYDLYFRNSDKQYSKWEEIKKKIFDISEFVTEFGEGKINDSLLKSSEVEKVTYHDPCHLKKSQNIYIRPREIISSLQGIDFVEMDEASSCCGFGGTFSLENYELSLKINDLKTSRIIRSNAQKVLTGCPGCIMQLQGGLLRHGSKIKVFHWVEEVL